MHACIHTLLHCYSHYPVKDLNQYLRLLLNAKAEDAIESLKTVIEALYRGLLRFNLPKPMR